MKRVLRLVAIAFVPAVTFVACGSRGPLDDEITPLVVDSGVADVAVVQDAAVQDTSAPDTGFDAGQGPIQCAQCVGQSCGTAIQTCLTDPACQAVLQCVVTTCFGGGGGGGGIDPSCITGCSSGGGPGIGEALGVFQCITTECGNPCGGLLGGLGGLGGGGGG